mmetsp:Transcript_8767/g.26946  ORF Transcript_8767/g.26946 Transcript_8767/m.26946 type:complete len:348 (-) Transcript_8767:1004-2047(-)|eukprot:scaffold194248_cov27-Tisochrysis_lutea.AAC.3
MMLRTIGGGGGTRSPCSSSTSPEPNSAGRAVTMAFTRLPSVYTVASSTRVSAFAPAADQSAWCEAIPRECPYFGKESTTNPARDRTTWPVTFSPTLSRRAPSAATLVDSAARFFFFWLLSAAGMGGAASAAAINSSDVDTCSMTASGSASRTTARIVLCFFNLGASPTTLVWMATPLGDTARMDLLDLLSSTTDPTRIARMARSVGRSASLPSAATQPRRSEARSAAAAAASSSVGVVSEVAVAASIARAVAILHRSAWKLAQIAARPGPSAPAEAATLATAAAADPTPSNASASAPRITSSCRRLSTSVRASIGEEPSATRASTDCPGAMRAQASEDASEMAAVAA